MLHLAICKQEACAACKAQSACATGKEGRNLVLADDGKDRKVGDEVVLTVTRAQGLSAVVLAYLLPVVLAITLLIVLQNFAFSEALIGTIVLGVLAVYFVILHIFRNKLQSELSIEIE
ncbi:hypothetical protein BN938_2134 [Mucinivorans hirudinis]|uniref:Sigma factor RpoE regulatory protein RseC n=1 Tax=Mucinivorans hirudinis TaxID=1433126 RepID=A0A060R9F1_9BACT|nr:hypothetical protein BN938_2134 [Mucinivorans hirudinis]